MLGKPFSELANAFFIGGAISSILFVVFSFVEKVCEQDEDIEELFSRLEDLEEKHELKKK